MRSQQYVVPKFLGRIQLRDDQKVAVNCDVTYVSDLSVFLCIVVNPLFVTSASHLFVIKL